MASLRNKLTSLISAFGLFFGLLAAIPLSFTFPSSATAATSDSCDGTYTNSTTKIKVTAQHGKIFYIDSGQGQNIDAAYVSYKIDNTDTSNDRSNIWASLDGFSGGVVQLANAADKNLPIGTINRSSSAPAFFLLKASTSSLRAQSHVVRIYSGNPTLAGSAELYSCTYTFVKVAETIKAAANKVTGLTSTVASKKVGETFTITVDGATGTLGAGNSIDGPSIWMTPAARSSWPTTALRLVTTSFDLFDKSAMNSGDRIATYPKTDTLSFKFASSGGKYYYRAVYTFRILAPASSSVALTPVGQISSGTQTKHTDLGSLPSSGSNTTTLNLSSPTLALKLTKSLSTTTTYSAGTTTFDYTLTLDNSAAGSTDITIDSVVDKPDSQLSFQANSARFDSSTMAVQPSYSTVTPTQLVFSGPFSVAAGATKTITYKMQKTSCTSGSYTVTNSAYANIGSLVIGSNATSFTQIVATGTCGTTTTSPTVTNEPLPILVLTYPATSVGTTSAVLNGAVNSYGVAGSTISFEYWRSGSSVTTVTAAQSPTTTSTNPVLVSYSIASGLSTGTVYYFRTKIGSTYGSTETFVTTEPTATPTVTTDAPTSVTSTDAQLNGTIDPNQTPVYLYYQVYTSNAGSSSQPYEFQIFDDLTAAYDSQTNTYSQYSGSFPVATSVNMSNTFLKNSNSAYSATATLASLISSNVTVNYRLKIVYVTGGNVILASSWKSFTMVNYLDQTITFANPSNIYWGDSAPAISPTSSSSLAVSVSVDPSSSTVCSWNGTSLTILSVGTCTLVADQGGGQSGANYYNSAPQVINSFEILPATLTVTAANKSKYYGEADPTLTYSYAFANGSLKTGDAFTGALTRNTGTNVGTYTITQGTLALNSNYTITYVSGDLTINAKPITITGDTLTKNIADADPTLTYQITSGGPLIGSDVFSGTAARNSGTTVGDYAITQGTVSLGSNYTITWVNGKLTITNKIVPHIVWSNPTAITYGTTLSSTQLNATVQVSSSDATNVPSTCVYTPAATALLDAGTQTLSVTCTPTDSTTYSSKTTTVTIVVNPAPLTVVVTAANRSYDTTRSASVTPGSLTGIVGSDDVTLTSGKITGVFGDATVGNSKTVTLTVASSPLGGAKAANYSLTTPTDPTANITPVTVTVTAVSQTVTQGGSLATFTYTLSSLAGSETGDPFTGITCSTDYLTSDSAGTSRSITCTGGTATNYVASHTAGTVTITASSSFTITYGTNDSDGGSAPSNTTGNGSVTLQTNSGNLTRSGYTFNGWSTGTGCSGTTYSAGASFTLSANVTLYPCWSANSTPAPAPAPVYVPKPPAITKISAAEVCAIGSQLVITGINLLESTVTVGGAEVRILSAQSNQLQISLPTQAVGTKKIVITNKDGSAEATVEYKFIDSPVYVNFIYPSTYQDMAFTYTFTATNTEKYSIDGVMPAGLTLNPLTGEISGTPTKAGNYLFTIVASNFCDQTYLDVYMFVDKAIPQTYTCTVPFLSPRSDAVSEFRLTQLRKCLDDIYTLSPATVAPVIFISGGLRSGLTIEQSLTHPRYLPILSLITSMNLNAQIYLGAFSGALDAVQLNIYWPMP